MVDRVSKALDALGDAALRNTLLFVRSRPGAQSADDLAVSLGVHRNVARSRLERLREAGLLESANERRTGRSGPGSGRPSKVYRPAPELDAIEFPRRHYETLISELVAHLDPRTRKATLEAVGVSFAGTLAEASALSRNATLAEGVEEICAAMGRLGFQASVVRCEETEAVLRTPTCPLRPLVQHTDAAAEIDRGFWEGMVDAAYPVAGVSARCASTGCKDDHSACEVLIEVGRSRRSPSGGA